MANGRADMTEKRRTAAQNKTSTGGNEQQSVSLLHIHSGQVRLLRQFPYMMRTMALCNLSFTVAAAIVPPSRNRRPAAIYNVLHIR